MSPVAETEIGRRLVDEARALAGAQRGELWGWLDIFGEKRMTNSKSSINDDNDDDELNDDGEGG